MAFTIRIFAFAAGLAALTLPAASQQATIAFGDLEQDTSLPVEVQADQLAVNNADGTAVFSGNVLVTQGDMTLAAAEVLVQVRQQRRPVSPDNPLLQVQAMISAGIIAALDGYRDLRDRGMEQIFLAIYSAPL